MDRSNLTEYINSVDKLFPNLSQVKRLELIARFEYFVYHHWSQNQSDNYNLIYLQRNCGNSANPFIQHFILSQHGDVVTVDNCIFSIPHSNGNQVSKPITFYTNIFPEVMLEFLHRRPDLVNILDVHTQQSILHQYGLDYRVLLFAYNTNKELASIRDNRNRTPLHHKNQPYGLITAILNDFPDLRNACDSQGNVVENVLGLPAIDL